MNKNTHTECLERIYHYFNMYLHGIQMKPIIPTGSCKSVNLDVPSHWGTACMHKTGPPKVTRIIWSPFLQANEAFKILFINAL